MDNNNTTTPPEDNVEYPFEDAATPAEDNAQDASAQDSATQVENGDNRMNERLERLGGEPAPVITPEEFARLQKAGQVHIDSRGRVRTERPRGVDPGVSLRKRRAWY